MAQYEIKDGKRVLVSRTQPANAKRTAPARPASEPSPSRNTPAAKDKTGAKTNAKED